MRITLQQIADRAGVSRGTVDRALKRRGRINAEVAENIRQIAREMGYSPNRAGRALAIGRQNLYLGVILQAADTPFMQNVLRGVEDAGKEAEQLGIRVELRSNPDQNAQKTCAFMQELLTEECQGLALIPVEDPQISAMIRSYHEKGIPVITFNSDLQDSGRDCFIGPDAIRSGRTAAGLMAEILPEGACAAVISGYPHNESHQNKVNGFGGELSCIRPDLQLLPVYYAYDNNIAAGRITEELLENYGDKPLGIYLAAAGAEGVCAVLRECRQPGQVKVVSNDLTNANKQALKEGYLQFLLGQDAYRQGYEPIMQLVNRLIDGTELPSEAQYINIDIKNRYNLE